MTNFTSDYIRFTVVKDVILKNCAVTNHMLWQQIQFSPQYEPILQATHFVQYTHRNFNWFGWPWWAGKPWWTRQSRFTHPRITLKKI